MKSWKNHINRVIFGFLPETSCFKLKSTLLRWAGAEVGTNVRICSSVRVIGTGDLKIGSDVWVGHNTLISTTSRVTIGSYIDIAPNVYIGTGSHRIDPVGRHSAGEGFSADVLIEDGVWLCAGSSILPGVTVGEKTVVCAGAMLIASCPSRVLVGGIPAKVIKTL